VPAVTNRNSISNRNIFVQLMMVEAERVYTLKNNFGAITDGTAGLMEVGAVEIGIGVRGLHRWGSSKANSDSHWARGLTFTYHSRNKKFIDVLHLVFQSVTENDPTPCRRCW